jgi:hypothetical protein
MHRILNYGDEILFAYGLSFGRINAEWCYCNLEAPQSLIICLPVNDIIFLWFLSAAGELRPLKMCFYSGLLCYLALYNNSAG